MKEEKTIDPKKFYTLGEIVREGLIPGVTNVPAASNLVKTDKMTRKILNGTIVTRGLKGMQYKIKGENIIKFLAILDDEKGNTGRFV